MKTIRFYSLKLEHFVYFNSESYLDNVLKKVLKTLSYIYYILYRAMILYIHEITEISKFPKVEHNVLRTCK